MKLTRLRLHGFKSFVEPSDFVIEPGLTGVVGPNGCGKSNLVEALRWVMGETSHKSLRGADMDSVIFAGSGNRPARNHAEVAMTIDNAEAAAGLAQITEMAAAEFVNRYAIQLGAEDAATLTAAAAVIGRWVLASPKPFALLHGDYRLDNLMFGADPQDVVALDWQTISVGPPARDLAYFLGTGLAVELRRAAEHELVAVYHGELLRRGVADYSFEQCFADYRLGQLQAPMITTIGCIYAPRERSDASDAMFLAMAKRSCAAIRDLGTLDLL